MMDSTILVAAVLGVTVAALVLLVFILRGAFYNELRHERWFKRIRNITGRAPALLIIDLLPGKNIGVGVEAFASDNQILSMIDKDRYFYLRWREDESIVPESMRLLSNRLRQLHEQLIEAKVDVLYLFYGGPAIVATMIGAEFANSSFHVILYHHSQGEYVNLGPLRYKLNPSDEG
jgi:hypothetical protein